LVVALLLSSEQPERCKSLLPRMWAAVTVVRCCLLPEPRRLAAMRCSLLDQHKRVREEMVETP